MSTLATSALIQSIIDLFTEAYAGPSNPSETWFIDNVPDSGILGILAGVSAVEASTSIDGSGQAASTIASNAEHLRWSLANTNAAMRGGSYNTHWTESWNLLEADEAAWDRLRAALRSEYEMLSEAIRSQDELSGVYLTGTLALIPHAAYHLGTIRQMIEGVRSNRKSAHQIGGVL